MSLRFAWVDYSAEKQKNSRTYSIFDVETFQIHLFRAKFLRVVSENLLNSVISPFCCIFACFIFCSLSVSERTHWRNTQSRWSSCNCSSLNWIILFDWILVADWLLLSCNRFLHRWSRCSASCWCCCRAGCCWSCCWFSCCCWSCLDFLKAIRYKLIFRATEFFEGSGLSRSQDFREIIESQSFVDFAIGLAIISSPLA